MVYGMLFVLLFAIFGGFTTNLENFGRALGKALLVSFIVVVAYRLAAGRHLIPADLQRILETTLGDVRQFLKLG